MSEKLKAWDKQSNMWVMLDSDEADIQFRNNAGEWQKKFLIVKDFAPGVKHVCSNCGAAFNNLDDFPQHQCV